MPDNEADPRRWVCVRLGPDGDEKGWCGHRHRKPVTALDESDRLNRTWGHVGERWKIRKEYRP